MQTLIQGSPDAEAFSVMWAKDSSLSTSVHKGLVFSEGPVSFKLPSILFLQLRADNAVEKDSRICDFFFLTCGRSKMFAKSLSSV